MRKIFLYECKRLLWNKFFAGLVLVLLFYGWQVLRRVTILGVSHTAPFSPWSFGDFLSRMLPLLWIGALFFLTFFTSEKARRAAVLTDAAPLLPRRYALARCAAALTGHRPAGAGLHLRSRLLLWDLFRLVWLERPGISHAGHTGPSAGVRTGQRLAVGNAPALAALCLDAGFSRLSGAPPAGIAGAVERAPLRPVSPDPGDTGPGVYAAGGRSFRPVRPAGKRRGPAGGSARGPAAALNRPPPSAPHGRRANFL